MSAFTINRRTIYRVLLIGLILYAGYSLWISRHATQKLRQLTNDLDSTKDSIQVLQNRYDSLYLQYDELYGSFSATRNQLDSIKVDIGNLINSRGNTVRQINSQLRDILESQPTFEKVLIQPDSFRLR